MKYIKSIIKNIEHDKKTFLFLLTTLICGIICGSVFMIVISKSDKALVVEHLDEFFTLIKAGKLDNLEVFKDVILSNFLFVILLWILGISVIGLFAILILLFAKGFTLGFTISAIVYKYKALGILNLIIYLFPHTIINMFVYIVISYFAYKLALKITNAVIKKDSINFKDGLYQYFKILMIALLVVSITAILESYAMPFFVDLFKTIF